MELNNAIRIVRREESLRSVRKEGTHLRLLYENEWVELLATAIEPGNSIGSSEISDFEAIHFVVEGGLLFHNASSSVLLLPGDSITLGKGEEYRISNTTSSRAVIWSLLFKKAGQLFDPEASSRELPSINSGPERAEGSRTAQTRREKNGGGL